MDLVADQLLANLTVNHAATIRAEALCVPFRTRFGRLPILGRRRQAFNADRLLNRLHDYPRYISARARSFDVFHVCDHSYANVVHRLPAERTGVFCHDLDTFRSILSPQKDPRPRWFRELARHILGGMQKAAVVFYTTAVVRAEIEHHGLVDPAKLVQARYGIGADFRLGSDGAADAAPPELERFDGSPFLLHVGSCIPRKRVDVLIEAFAAARRARPELRLLQVGGQWTSEQSAQLARHGLAPFVLQIPRLSQAEVSEIYRRAALVLMPSESEGFGLPVVEALACGSIVLTSDIPVFREVGGPAVVFCPMGIVEQWVESISRLIDGSLHPPAAAVRLEWAAQFSWAEHTRRITAAYRNVSLP
jgi:glycosyltransferase involved in cell wall biosynthesis